MQVLRRPVEPAVISGHDGANCDVCFTPESVSALPRKADIAALFVVADAATLVTDACVTRSLSA
jgi:hypothetical protein